MSGKSEQLCRFYSRTQKCRFGDTCRYLHEAIDLSAENIVTDKSQLEESPGFNLTEVASTSFKKTTKYEGLNSTESGEIPALLQPRSISDRKNQRKICNYFAKHQRCAFGRNCRFIHERSDSQNAVKSELDPDSKTIGDNFKSTDDSYRYDSQIVEDTEVHSSSTQPDAQNDQKEERKICNFFARSGRCPYKSRCRFKHVRGYERPPRFETSEKVVTETEERDLAIQEPQKEAAKVTKPKVNRKLCRYFRNGHCKAGERCRFWHPVDVMEDLTDNFNESAITEKTISETTPSDVSEDIRSSELQDQKKNIPRPNQRSYPTRAPVRPVNHKISLKREIASDDEMDKLRRTEIDQLQKRFPRDRCTVEKDEPDIFECRVKFSPTDPDWPYDVRKFELLFTVPAAYPQEMLTVTLPADQDLPETVRRYIELCVADWVIEKGDQLEEAGVFEIVFRPFLRWFDKNLQTNVTEALKQMKREIVAKAAGFEFINAAELQSKYKATEDKVDSDEENEDDESEETEEDDSDENDEDDENSDDQRPKHDVGDIETEKKGTEVSLKYLQLRDGAATLLFEKIRIIIQCGRCKNHSDFSTPPRRVNAISCSKCNNDQMVIFRPVLVHQFSSVIGYLDLDNCTVFDLVLQESVSMVGCMTCSKESKIDGIVPGQPLNTWCRHCHQKMMIAAESVRFAQLQPSGTVTDPEKVHQIATKKRVQKDPAIQEGKPLPEYGACKHYKKSYRWFRFPCCGMVYPCDVCHEEKSDDHEMVFANRVICGFCCKEQPYSPDKPCIMCQQMLTRSKSSHWEGGLGCRSKVKMSKNDSQKYSNTNKTISKQAQKLKDSKTKKKTKA